MWLDETTFQITANSMSACPTGCERPGTIYPFGSDSIQDVAGNDWDSAGDNTLEDPDRTAPVAITASVYDSDLDGQLSVGDIVSIVFDEQMRPNTPDGLDAIFYGAYGAVVPDPSLTWWSSSELRFQVTNVPGDCVFIGCPLGGDITAVQQDFIEDHAGNDWALGGDVTL